MTDRYGSEAEFETLLEYLRTSRGFDFTDYKRTSLARRINKRMEAVGTESYGLYLDLLQVDPSEFEQLFNFILINVTSFFRDPEIFKYLQEDIVPNLVAVGDAAAPIRVWSAGCASGEEAYSLVMVLAEALGRQQVLERVKVYATDIDQEALNAARQGTYSSKQVESVPDHLLGAYFEQNRGEHTFDKQLRRVVIFGRHDLLQDAPISRVDILTCRNTLMYFNNEAQAKIMSRFYFALNDDGVLVLGKAEMSSGYRRAFVPVDIKRRVFAKGPEKEERDRLLLLAQAGNQEALGQLNNHIRAREVAFEVASLAQVVVDRAGLLVLANARAREMFGLQPGDLGRPFNELEMSWKPAQLQNLVDQAARDKRKISLSGLSWQALGNEMFLDIDIIPLHDNGSRLLGVAVQCLDVSREKNFRIELEQSNQELETAIEELHSTNEELETTNEELQSTNEELETTNEELQSTNEELETMNEELQSTNEELSATNDELRSRTHDLNRLNRFLETLMSSINTSVIVVDTGLRIQLWNRRSFEMWGLRDDEVIGTPFLAADIGLPRDVLTPALMDCIGGKEGLEHMELGAVNRKGKTIRCRVAITPMSYDGSHPEGAILLIEHVEGEGHAGGTSHAGHSGQNAPSVG